MTEQPFPPPPPAIGYPSPALPTPVQPPNAPKRPWQLFAGLAAVAAVAAGGTYAFTRPDDAASTTSVVTVPVSSTLPGTPPLVTTTTAPTTDQVTTLPADGALDLGEGMVVGLPDGFSVVEAPEGVTRLGNGEISLDVQVLPRTPGEAADVLAQEYAATFDGDFDAVTYSPVTSVLTSSGLTRVSTYDYTTFTTGGSSLYGVVEILTRADGLSVVVDQYAAADVEQTPQSAWLEEVSAAFAAAPSLGADAALSEAAPFDITSVHPTVELSPKVRFTPAPGFTIERQENNIVTLSNGTYVFEAEFVPGVATIDDLVTFGKVVLGDFLPEASVDTTDDLTSSTGVIRRTLRVDGVATTGQAVHAFADFYFDPATGNGVWTWNAWNASDGDSDPFADEVLFMLRSLTIQDGIS
jgi:hypothetical protein